MGSCDAPYDGADQGGTVDQREEMTAFCRREHRRLVGLLALHVGDRLVAEELAQDTLVRVCQRWPQIRQTARPSAWASRVALNLASTWWRRRGAERRAHARHGASPTEAATADPADVLAVRGAVAELPERMRTALILRYYAELPVAEVADHMGCAEGTVKSLTSQAISALRERSGLLEGMEVDRVP